MLCRSVSDGCNAAVDACLLSHYQVTRSLVLCVMLACYQVVMSCSMDIAVCVMQVLD